jgi:hypothetical protein
MAVTAILGTIDVGDRPRADRIIVLLALLEEHRVARRAAALVGGLGPGRIPLAETVRSTAVGPGVDELLRELGHVHGHLQDPVRQPPAVPYFRSHDEGHEASAGKVIGFRSRVCTALSWLSSFLLKGGPRRLAAPRARDRQRREGLCPDYAP